MVLKSELVNFTCLVYYHIYRSVDVGEWGINKARGKEFSKGNIECYIDVILILIIGIKLLTAFPTFCWRYVCNRSQ